ncbi:uncharacterized protein LOC130443327 [Diorhabda sublineata]|uniref:uncharacterized protein LOC130443327 n=1 Tax=Diorhabda sublineata TaxID=1163346 RepID=UPI0024E0A8B8|nr:uncharacterized protein LOC130443327 [Diorhabda sublineata]
MSEDKENEKLSKNTDEETGDNFDNDDVTHLPRPTVSRRPKTPEIDDPVRFQKLQDKKSTKKKVCSPPCVPCNKKESVASAKIEPTISHRLDFKYFNQGLKEDEVRRVYVSPVKLKKKYPPKEPTAKYHYVPSPEISSAKVELRKATPTPSSEPFSPEKPDEEQLDLKKPKSGIFINVTEDEKQVRVEDYDSFDLVYQRKPRPSLVGRKRKDKTKSTLDDISEGDEGGAAVGKKKRKKKISATTDLEYTADEMDLLEALITEDYGENEGEERGVYLTKMFRRKVSLMSAATSYQSKDIPHSTISTVSKDGINKYIQKFRRDSEIRKFQPKKRKIKRGTIQSHSFTNMYQPILQDFFFGSKQGSMHQGLYFFLYIGKNKQGICMPVAAYCYSMLSHPNKWTRENIDEILSWGNNLYMETLKRSHFHNFFGELDRKQLLKYCTIGCKKMRISIEDPFVTGYIRSDDKRIFNLTKALKIFFASQTAGIFKTQDITIAIWKNKYLYMFDARPRTKDLYVSCDGTAVMANFYDVPSLATIFLSRSNFCNWPFAIYPMKVYKIMNADELEKDSNEEINVKSEYNILNENKAVVLGSFDLADKCFEFSRGKQSLPMSVLALVYSRITPPNAWNRKTIDKILILGNLLYKECLACKASVDIKLEHLPALFTIGPYIVEIYIFGNLFADLIYRSCNCQLKMSLESFFEKCTNGILQIGRCHLAVWKQRNMFYCFDPYSRNNEGFATTHGMACVSMHASLDSVIELIAYNYDKDSVFYLHALKVCKIHRDPCQSGRFPRHLSMDDFPVDTFKKYKMRKSKKSATEKPVTVDYSAVAMRRLLAGESPQVSVLEIGSTIGSIRLDEMQTALCKKCPSLSFLKLEPKKSMGDIVADLDRPSLSDTQIEPPLPQQSSLAEPIEFMDLDDFELTMEEIELEVPPAEGEGLGAEGYKRAYVEGGAGPPGEETGAPEEWYYATDKYSQFVLDQERSKISEEINTDLTYFPIRKDILYPTYVRGKQQMQYRLQKYKFTDEDWENYLPPSPPEITRSQELKKETNFIDLPDDTQIILGSKNVGDLGEPVEYIAPFICIMASVVAKKYSLGSWTGDIVDYILKCGNELYTASKFRYDQVSKLEIPRITLGNNAYTVLVEYIFDSHVRQNILELALEKILFVRSDTGVIVTPMYACAVIKKNYLYYVYDPFGNNEVGLSEGPGGKGMACFARFKDLHSLTTRILYNKKKRETVEKIVYSRFVLSSVKVKEIRDFGDVEEKKKKQKTKNAASSDEEPEDRSINYDVGEDEIEGEEEHEEPVNKVGYQYKDGYYTITGTKVLPNREAASEELTEDHFICICSCLILLTTPINKWDTKKVDLAMDYGMHVFSHADDLLISEKRTIKNILVGKYFFDIIIKMIKIEDWKQNRHLSLGIDYLLTKKLSYFLIQFSNACYVIHKSQNDFYHIFDPYGQPKELPAGWLRCKDVKQLKRHLRKKVVRGAESYTFYTFEVTSIRKAPKDLVLSHKLQMYDLASTGKKEKQDKPFYEDVEWLKMDPIAWSRKNAKAANGKIRGTPENLWHNWDEEYTRDLYSLMGNINQYSSRFSSKTRGKQTLANLVVAIGMTKIYDLEEWNSAVVDSVLVNGDNYFIECTDSISEDDYELTIDDLINDCSIFPFSFKVNFNPVVEGTMFLVRHTQYNLYKALRFFFQSYKNRCGLLFATRQERKRQVAFGKLQESEYFMFDASCHGNPMFLEGTGVAYILRMTTLNRLLHVLTLTLRGGDFYIYEVEITDLKPLA